MFAAARNLRKVTSGERKTVHLCNCPFAVLLCYFLLTVRQRAARLTLWVLLAGWHTPLHWCVPVRAGHHYSWWCVAHCNTIVPTSEIRARVESAQCH
jgi:hypothetical protein